MCICFRYLERRHPLHEMHQMIYFKVRIDIEEGNPCIRSTEFIKNLNILGQLRGGGQLPPVPPPRSRADVLNFLSSLGL